MVKYVKGGKMIAGKNYVKARSVYLGVPLGVKDGYKYYSTKLGLIAVPDIPDFEKASNIETDYKTLADYEFDTDLPKPEQIYKEKKTGKVLGTRPSLADVVYSEATDERVSRLGNMTNWRSFLTIYRDKNADELKGVPYKEVQKRASAAYKEYKDSRDLSIRKAAHKKLKDRTVNKNIQAKVYNSENLLSMLENRLKK